MKPRIQEYKNKSFRARRLKCAQLYMYKDYSMSDALWASYMSDAPNDNPSRAFNAKGMKKAIRSIENQIVAREAKTKELVVSDLEEREEDLAGTAEALLELVDKLTKDAASDPDEVGKLTKAVNALKGVEKIRQDIGNRVDKLQGRLVADAKNPKDVEGEALLSRLKDSMKPKEPKPAEVIDVESQES